ncbi:MAG TPA: single-stranded DNA-binding protein [Planctomycetota bacterium]|jgi:single-strand DNA-binding protein|nr:single-stranded DNA-binding protein [Planctomycetota bacterium]
MTNFNHVVLVGRLARDPELRYTAQGKAVAHLTVAVNHRYVKEDGSKVEETAFVDVTVWNRQAEAVAEFLTKGRAVLVSGRLVQDHWQDEETGLKRSKLRVVAQQVSFLGGEPKGEPSEEAEPAAEAPASAPPRAQR